MFSDDELQAKCPESTRLVAVADESQKLGEFLEWVQERYTLCQTDRYDRLFPCYPEFNQLLADYYGIDLDKVEAERRALLDEIRQQAEQDEVR